jgi:small-conductance mechanosensitive channel
MTEEKGKKLELFKELLKRCVIPLASAVVLVVFYAAYITKVRQALEINWHAILDKTFFILAILVIAYWVKMVSVGVFNWYAARVAEQTSTTIDEEFIPLFKKVTSIIIWAIAFIIVLSYLGVNITALITTLGVASLAIALAAKDTISNVIAGFLIMIDRPFKIGDRIKLPSGEKVEVLYIGHRRSKFRAQDGSIVIVPNLDLSKSKIVNYTYSGKFK